MAAVRGKGYLTLDFGAGAQTIIGLTDMELSIDPQTQDASDLTTDMAPKMAKVGYNWSSSGSVNFQDDQVAQYTALIAASKSPNDFDYTFVEEITGVVHSGRVLVGVKHTIATRQLQKLALTLSGNGELTTTAP